MAIPLDLVATSYQNDDMVKNPSTSKFLAIFWKHVIFSFKRVEIRKISEAF